MTAYASHYRKLASAALDESDPSVQASACGVVARALLDCAAELDRLARQNLKAKQLLCVLREYTQAQTNSPSVMHACVAMN
jgi:hypothetical protein